MHNTGLKALCGKHLAWSLFPYSHHITLSYLQSTAARALPTDWIDRKMLRACLDSSNDSLGRIERADHLDALAPSGHQLTPFDS